MDDSEQTPERRWPPWRGARSWRPWRSGGGDADGTTAPDEATSTDEGTSEDEAPMRETVLVAGSDAPVGRATARRFRAAGWRVYAAAPDPDALTDLEAAGCETVELHPTADANVAGVVRRIVEEAGRLDCLVTGPGRGRLGPVEDLPADDLAGAVDGTVLGPHRLARRALPHMRERGEGTIVTVASALGRVGVPGATAVCAPAAALATATDALRGEVAPFGVNVVLVETGPVRREEERRRTRTVGSGALRPSGDATRARADGAGSTDRDGDDPTDRATGTGSSIRRGEWSGGDDGRDDAERTDAYASLYDTLDDARVVGPALEPVPPERVAETVLNAASCTKPAPRYGVGRAAQVARLASLVPARWRDRAFGVLRRLP